MLQEAHVKGLLEAYAKTTKERHGVEIDLPKIVELQSSAVPDVDIAML